MEKIFQSWQDPCAVESREQILDTALKVKEAGATILRGGAFKPRSSPYSFQGLKEKGLEMLAEAKEKTGLSIVTEVMTAEHVPLVGGGSGYPSNWNQEHAKLSPS